MASMLVLKGVGKGFSGIGGAGHQQKIGTDLSRGLRRPPEVQNNGFGGSGGLRGWPDPWSLGYILKLGSLWTGVAEFCSEADYCLYTHPPEPPPWRLLCHVLPCQPTICRCAEVFADWREGETHTRVWGHCLSSCNRQVSKIGTKNGP